MTMSSDQERMLRRFMKKSKARGDDEKEYKNQTLLRKFMKKKAKAQKDYKKHEFLRFIVETAMKREKMDIDTDDHIDRKIQKKIQNLRERSRPKLVDDQLQSKKPVFYISCQPALREKKKANFREVVEVEEEKVVLVSNDDDVDDDDYEKEVMNKKSSDGNKKNNNKGKKTCKLPVEPPNEEICKLMLEKISEIKGLNPIWLGSKILTISDQDAGLGRYFIPRCDKLVNFLRKEELDIIEDGIHCRALDQHGERWDLVFKYYDCLHQYAFLGSWKSLLRSFGLLRPKAEPKAKPKPKPKASKNAPEPKKDVPDVPGGKIDLWCFRLPDKDLSLSFALRITRL